MRRGRVWLFGIVVLIIVLGLGSDRLSLRAQEPMQPLVAGEVNESGMWSANPWNWLWFKGAQVAWLPLIENR